MTKNLTPKQEAFLEALLGEARGHIRAATDIAGYSRTTKTAEVVGPRKEEITERPGMMLAMNAPKAAFGIVDVLDYPSAMGAMSSGKFLFDLCVPPLPSGFIANIYSTFMKKIFRISEREWKSYI